MNFEIELKYNKFL